MKFQSIVLLVALGSFLFSCSAKVSESSRATSNRALEQEKMQNTNSDRKIIYDASIQIQVKKLEHQVQQTIETAKRFKGYMVSSSLTSATLRIPAEQMNAFLEEVSQQGKVKDRQLYSRDVTEEYLDLTLRLDNAEQSRVRYLQLLEKAEDVTDILAIERELERLQNEIERLKGQQQRLDELIAFSTVTVYFQEKVRPGPIGYIFVGLYEAVKFLFIW